MKKNMGSTDRIIRIIIAIVLGVLYKMEIVSGTLGLVAFVVSVIFVLTSLINYCPLYAIFGIKTCSVDK